MKVDKIHIISVDDHEVISNSVKRILEEYSSDIMVTMCQRSSELRGLIKSESVDLIILDYDLADDNATEIIPQIRLIDKDVKIIVYTMHDETWVVSSLLKLGVDGIVSKEGRVTEITDAFDQVYKENETYFSKKIYNVMVAELGHEKLKSKLVYTPTTRETEVLGFLSDGFTSEEIADKMHLTKNTVDTIRKNILSKSGAKNVSNLVKISMQKGWI